MNLNINDLRERFTPEQIQHFFSQLDEKEAEQILYDWEFWARKDQLPPGGDWFYWVVLSGRGFGKTRMGAQWIIQRAKEKHDPIILVGETAGDVRDVMVEVGESSILKNSPPWFTPLYEPSKRRLTWPNGVVATTFSATEPEQLRGPQSATAWCLAEGTLITTDQGDIPVEELTLNHKVLTRRGFSSILASELTGEDQIVYKISTTNSFSLLATDNHMVYTNRGFIPTSDLQAGDRLCTLNLMEGNIKRPIVDITVPIETISTETFINIILEIFLREWLYIIKTIIQKIITQTTYNVCLEKNTLDYIQKIGNSLKNRLNNFKDIKVTGKIIDLYLTESALFVNRILQPKEQRNSVHLNVLINTEIQKISQLQKGVKHAILGLQPQGGGKNIVLNPVNKKTIALQRIYQVLSNVTTAIPLLSLKGETLDSVHGHVQYNTTVEIENVERYPLLSKVYDITSVIPEFFANGILVHNCDELAKWKYLQECWDNLVMGCRVGDSRIMVTTTPKPKPLIKKLYNDPQARVTIGSTYDNSANLNPNFIRQLKDKYEGTRLGQQELHGKILWESEDSLFKMSDIEGARVNKKPNSFSEMAIGVDPSVSADTSNLASSRKANETGIVVGGISGGEGYCIEDGSLLGSPQQWATKVANLWNKYNQEPWIIAEKNNGGLMVMETLTKYGIPQHRIILVHASQGKIARAEPISLLVEQGKIHHIGEFPKLEDQLVAYEGVGPSPDRYDAYVWCFTHLLMRNRNKVVTQVLF